MSPKSVGIAVGALLVLAIALWLLASSPRAEHEILSRDIEPATTTPATTTSVVKPPNTLPPEPEFKFPEGANVIDAYAFTLNNYVYFRSLTAKEPLLIQDADASTFARLTNFTTYPGTDVVATCGTAPIYSFYGDEKHLYFYQVWRAPMFRTSQIEVVLQALPQDFESTTEISFKSNKHTFSIHYEKTAKGGCILALARL
jgi:hypothetical protein